MFYIYADGKSIYETIDEKLTLQSPKLKLEMGKAGSLQFVVPPSHRFFTFFQQLKTGITVELDGEEIFRGRVLTNNRNFNNMRTVYCEGNLAYLVDSVQKGERFVGTTHELFRKIIRRHNERVEPAKRFEVGVIGIADRPIIVSGTSEETEDAETTKFDYEQIVLNSTVDNWQTSFDYIESCLIDYCGGYLRVRREGTTNYIDLITDYGNTATQEIEFGTNMLDLTEEVSAEDVFTVLVPLGDDNLTIAEVNNGSDELVDVEGVERYGRIVKTHVFDNVNQASTLLENAQRYMSSHVNLPITLSVKAVDLHLLNKSIKEIRVGDRVHVNSLPHNIVEYLICTAIEYDLDNPANNTYTFGNPHQSMTERYRKDKKKKTKNGGGAVGEAAEEEMKQQLDEFFDAWINVDKDAAHIDLGTLYKKYSGDRETLESYCGISLDAPSGNINIKTLRKEFDELGDTVTEQSAYIDFLNNELGARIDLVAANHKQLENLESTHHAEMMLFADELEAKINLNTKHLTTIDRELTDSQANIAMLSNSLQAQITLEATHKKELDGKITSSNTKINQVASDLQAQITLEAAHKRETDGKITSSNTKIDQVASDLQSQITLEAAHKKELDGKITSSNTKIDQVASDLQAQITLEAKHKKDLDTSIASIQIMANDLGSEIKLKADKTTLNSKVTTINSEITTINSDITQINSKITEMDTVIANKINAALIASKDIVVGKVTSGAITAFSINVPGVFGRMTYGGKQVATQDWVLQQLSKYASSNHTHSFSGSTTLAWGHVHTTSSSFSAGKDTSGVKNYSNKTIIISGTTGAAN